MKPDRLFCCDGRFVSVVEFRSLVCCFRQELPAATKFFGFFGGCIRGQEESWSNQEEGSQEEGC
jgi:hypothetical protein